MRLFQYFQHQKPNRFRQGPKAFDQRLAQPINAQPDDIGITIHHSERASSLRAP